MVLLYIEGKVGDFTVYLDRPIEKPWFVALRGCTFYNRWKNLSSEGTVSDGRNIILRIPAGHYTVETLNRQIDSALRLGKSPIAIEKSSLKARPTVVLNDSLADLLANQNVTLNDSLADLLGLKHKSLKEDSRHEIRMKTLDAIFIHCDLVSASGVLKQGAPSQILACVEVDRGVGEKINYSPHSPIQHGTGCVDYVSSLRLSVTDGDGNAVENLYPMRLILEIT